MQAHSQPGQASEKPLQAHRRLISDCWFTQPTQEGSRTCAKQESPSASLGAALASLPLIPGQPSARGVLGAASQLPGKLAHVGLFVCGIAIEWICGTIRPATLYPSAMGAVHLLSVIGLLMCGIVGEGAVHDVSAFREQGPITAAWLLHAGPCSSAVRPRVCCCSRLCEPEPNLWGAPTQLPQCRSCWRE